ncbi:plasmid replication protein RepC [Rhizobium leguminosarum]|uniref:plasmid replication protein RepC n=1 Tax=Rhizobium leguminosarum TaxID=384 RepID=UPI001AE50E2D|nr:plasmid replication protein RepC [Rhizobium leguminosarum]MBP2449972.1 replication initiation protein RepC [Rhizobium leguminosarum]
MQTEHIATPFGRRRMTLALVKAQFDSPGIKKGKSAGKWKIYRDACEARSLLGLRDRALAVLNALLSFYPETDLIEGGNLVVFPSNAQLIVRANGIAGTTLRENLGLLVRAGLIQRNDSPNGKRYARKGRDGSIEIAYGFSLAPLLARSEELALMAQQVAEENRRLKVIKEQITIARRDIRKLISAATEEGAAGDWHSIEGRFVAITNGLRTVQAEARLAESLDELTLLREEIVNLLEVQLISGKAGTNGAENRQHIEHSNTESILDFETRAETEHYKRPNQEWKRECEQIRSFPLEMVVRACPQISDYAPGGRIGQWRDLTVAAVVVRSMLGVSPSAYQEACEVMRPENAAITIACILERASDINSAGAYLRDLTARAARGEFSLGPMLMALMRIAAPTRTRSA